MRLLGTSRTPTCNHLTNEKRGNVLKQRRSGKNERPHEAAFLKLRPWSPAQASEKCTIVSSVVHVTRIPRLRRHELMDYENRERGIVF